MKRGIVGLSVVALIAGCGQTAGQFGVGQHVGSGIDARSFYKGIGVSVRGTLTPETSTVIDREDFGQADSNKDSSLSVDEINRFFMAQNDPNLRIKEVDPIVPIVGIGGGILAGYLIYTGSKVSKELVKPRKDGSSHAHPNTFKSDGQDLAYVYLQVEPPTSRAIVLCHAHASNKEAMLAVQPMLKEYNILAFDFRNHGASGGKVTTGGYLESQDVQAAIMEAKRRGNQTIGLFGVGMGGVASLNAAAKDASVAGVVADSPYAMLEDDLARRASNHKYPMPEVVGRAAKAITSLRTGTASKLADGDAVNLVSKNPNLKLMAVLDEQLVLKPSWDKLLAAAPGAKETYVREASSLNKDFEARVQVFFSEAMKSYEINQTKK